MRKITRLNLCTGLLLLCLFACKKETTTEETQSPGTPLAKTVLMVVTSNDQLKDGSSAGYFLPEAIDFYKRLTAAGYKVVIASPAGGKAPMYERATYASTYKNYLDSSGLLSKLDNTTTLSSVHATDYQAVFYVGGFACLFDFPSNADIKRITTSIYESGGIVAAVCHAPAALLNVTLSNGELLIKNKKLTSRTVAEETSGGMISRDDVLYFFPMLLEDELKNKGAVYSNAPMGRPYAVTDERLVTGQNPESATLVADQALLLMK